MRLAGLNFERELEMWLYYKDESIGSRRVDFFVEKTIMIEIKAITNLEDVHLAQAMNYVEAYKMEGRPVIKLRVKKVCNLRELIILS